MPTINPVVGRPITRATDGRRYADRPMFHGFGTFSAALVASSLSAIFWGLVFMLPTAIALIVVASVAVALVLVCVA